MIEAHALGTHLASILDGSIQPKGSIERTMGRKDITNKALVGT